MISWLAVVASCLVADNTWALPHLQDPPQKSTQQDEVVDLRGIWDQQRGLNKKKAEHRGLIPSDLRTPKKVSDVPPIYPQEERAAFRSGTVVLECRIDVHGIPRDCHAARSVSSGFSAAALASVKQWRYTPLYVRGEPRAALVEIAVNFVIR